MYFGRCGRPWYIWGTGRSDSEAAIRHMADIYVHGDTDSPWPVENVVLRFVGILSVFCRFSDPTQVQSHQPVGRQAWLSADRSPRPLTVSTDPGRWNADWQANGHGRAPLTVSSDPGRWNDDWQAKSRRRISFHNSPPTSTSRWQAGASRGFPP